MYCEKFPIAQKDPGMFLITVSASFVLTLIKPKTFLKMYLLSRRKFIC
jgi:hypothetical protein